jgi:hypothetical protein
MKKYLKANKEILPPAIAFLVITISFFIVKYNISVDKDYDKNLLLAGGFGITILSWFVVGYINNENEKKRSQLSINQSILESKRNLKVKFLLDAYFRLESAGHREMNYPDRQKWKYDYVYKKYSESALTAIQLLGDEDTVKLANAYTLAGGEKHYDELLKMLRDDLRKELGLKQLPNTKDYDPTTLRVYLNTDAPDELTPERQLDLAIRLSEFNRELVK